MWDKAFRYEANYAKSYAFPVKQTQITGNMKNSPKHGSCLGGRAVNAEGGGCVKVCAHTSCIYSGRWTVTGCGRMQTY